VSNIQHLFLGVVILCFITGLLLSSFNLTLPKQRRIYWSSACLAAVSGFLMFNPDWKTGLGIAGMFLAAMFVAAYAATPYIKIRGKIYALTVSLRQPDPEDTPPPDNDRPARAAGVDQSGSADRGDPSRDSYSGALTPATFWWMSVVFAVIASGNAYFVLAGRGGHAAAAGSVGLLLFVVLGAGYGDASWGYCIARGQYLQFGIMALITAGSAALVYLIAFYTARRWPLRRPRSWSTAPIRATVKKALGE
jgi:hypothetical protein